MKQIIQKLGSEKFPKKKGPYSSPYKEMGISAHAVLGTRNRGHRVGGKQHTGPANQCVICHQKAPVAIGHNLPKIRYQK